MLYRRGNVVKFHNLFHSNLYYENVNILFYIVLCFQVPRGQAADRGEGLFWFDRVSMNPARARLFTPLKSASDYRYPISTLSAHYPYDRCLMFDNLPSYILHPTSYIILIISVQSALIKLTVESWELTVENFILSQVRRCRLPVA